MRAAALVALLALGACKPAHKPEPIPPPPVPASLATPLSWAAGDHAIILRETGADLLRIGCGPKGLTVIGERFTPIASEERMNIGAGDVIVTLVAAPANDRTPPTVRGEGPADPFFLQALGEGRKVAVNYGYQNMGPYDGPPPAMAQAFVDGCKG